MLCVCRSKFLKFLSEDMDNKWSWIEMKSSISLSDLVWKAHSMILAQWLLAEKNFYGLYM